MFHKLTTIVPGLLICALIAGCITTVDETLPHDKLPEISVGTDISLIASPSDPISYLSSDLIKEGEQAQVIGTDENAAWLLILSNNRLGWMPTIFSRSNIGTLTPPIIVEPLSSTCSKYLGATFEPEEEWVSNSSGSVIVLGSIYRPKSVQSFENASLAINIDGSNTPITADYIHTPLTTSSAVILFGFSIDDAKKGSRVSFDLLNSGKEPVSFQAAFFSNTCPDALEAAEVEFTDQLPVGKTKVEIVEKVAMPEGDAPTLDPTLPEAGSPPTPVPTPIIIVIQSGPGYSTKACPNTYPTRLQVGTEAVVAVEARLNVRSSAHTDGERVGQIEPYETVTIRGGPECAESMIWWDIKSTNGTSGWVSEGDANEYFLRPLSDITTISESAARSGCQRSVTGKFGNLWQKYQRELGCPNEERELGADKVYFVEQWFQNGHLFFFGSGSMNFVIAKYGTLGGGEPGRGDWQSFPSEAWSGMDENFCNEGNGLEPPIYDNFNKAWCFEPGVRDKLGYPRDIDTRLRARLYGADNSQHILAQGFEKGFILRDSDGASSHLAYIFLYDGDNKDRGKYIRDYY